MKDKGLLLSKLPRATEMRLLSRRGKRKQMDPQAGALPQSISAGDQPRLIQGIRRRDGVGEDQETIA
ncbi:hypothetical protein ANAPC1_01260 [Anaplasma phagocytophilum]|uniref:Uncharacterized protein n=1 Tax=Anaplasma phagocytophilum TaxID=948 RepID=A0AA45UU14_ANAPH|nr:hypothetical protein ANAPC1_01260 [Anaplasma phagocytophilum]SBO33243.1 hypothetical protein ANAPC2_01298 [Anaplasma phagocytophilum]SBO33696.1 hypothetical protein ANAPC4_01257 [Anaplasma phagocytophilum]